MVWYFLFLCGNSRPASKSRLCCDTLQDFAIQEKELPLNILCGSRLCCHEDFAHVFCRAGKGIAAEQQLEFHFWARLIFSMVVSWRILPTSINLQKKRAAMWPNSAYNSLHILKKLKHSETTDILRHYATSKFVQFPHGREGGRGVKSNCTSV